MGPWKTSHNTDTKINWGMKYVRHHWNSGLYSISSLKMEGGGGVGMEVLTLVNRKSIKLSIFNEFFSGKHFLYTPIHSVLV